jgi:hypothetical protein
VSAGKSLLRSAAADERWASLTVQQRRDRTANARMARDDKFAQQAAELAAQHGNELNPKELAESAERLRRAYFKRLAAKSVTVRRARSLKSRIPDDGAGGET